MGIVSDIKAHRIYTKAEQKGGAVYEAMDAKVKAAYATAMPAVETFFREQTVPRFMQAAAAVRRAKDAATEALIKYSI